jgi:beta-aspartyl-peptidase (threonine type)
VVHGELVDLGGEGGVIAIDPQGTVVMDFNTEGMYRAAIGTNGGLTVRIYQDE